AEPDFSLYPRTGAPVCWRSNPRNPTGLLAASDDRADVWDEAFYPLATGRWTRGDVDAIVVGSLTKLFAAPGLRAGYALAAPAVIERLRARQPEWSVNGLVAAALPDLHATVDLVVWAAQIAELRDGLRVVLRRHGFDPR